MTTGDKAKRATVAIGSSQVDAFQMPDGSYCMSQAQVAECIGTTPQNASNFLRSKAFKALRGGESTDQSFETMRSNLRSRPPEVPGSMRFPWT
ncbi:hypothetical protein [Nodosilinea sp. E11]|uniref:hypothetical protein n=1 Tax=Nodosilinea sp. E11 TaxID=3037479 RepID=UPI0029349985|nr:hypothetical protein [Nodosilinea sp. E11]WOD37314.1 hypothetical protein RRF56_02325 [Nodosilinea sp. E11]